ncbi:AraC family transcriptional regulator [Maricurvus nonylphenolicus]|uniref:AraC family transcriptional regulator n=1 Tax=Maricurvus nonylphenolicus TaxID=1008307 RepID=UPI0036F271A1
MAAVTVSSQLVRQVLIGTEKKGISSEELLKLHGIPAITLKNERMRVSVLAFAGLIQSITSRLNDDALGLIDETIPSGTFMFIFRACQSATTIAESIQIICDGINLIGKGVSISLYNNKNACRLEFTANHAPAPAENYIYIHVFAAIHRFLCWQTNDFIPIKRVDLNYPSPSYASEYRFNFYGSPIHFDKKVSAIYFAKEHLDRKCVRSNQELKDFLDNYISQLIIQSRQSQLTSVKVRIWLEQILKEGVESPDITNAAAHLDISEYALRRRLNAENYPFNKIKEHTRRDVAILHLENNIHSIEKIAFDLGFSEASTFIRSFKRWTGLTPLAYRKLLLSES